MASRFSVKLASMDATGLTVTKRDFDLLGFLDELLSGKEPTPDGIVTAVFQIYRSFGIEDARIRGLEMTLPLPENPGQPVTLSMGEAGLSHISSDKIGEIRISDMKTSPLPNGAEFSLGKVRLGNLDFAPYGPMADLIPTLIKEAGRSKPDPMRIARVLMPRSISYGLENLHVVAPGEGEVTIGNLAHDFFDHGRTDSDGYLHEDRQCLHPGGCIEQSASSRVPEKHRLEKSHMVR